jgi:hypothetical protein
MSNHLSQFILPFGSWPLREKKWQTAVAKHKRRNTDADNGVGTQLRQKVQYAPRSLLDAMARWLRNQSGRLMLKSWWKRWRVAWWQRRSRVRKELVHRNSLEKSCFNDSNDSSLWPKDINHPMLILISLCSDQKKEDESWKNNWVHVSQWTIFHLNIWVLCVWKCGNPTQI